MVAREKTRASWYGGIQADVAGLAGLRDKDKIGQSRQKDKAGQRKGRKTSRRRTINLKRTEKNFVATLLSNARPREQDFNILARLD